VSRGFGGNPDMLIVGMVRPVTIQVRGRGTVTLPAPLRAKYRLDEGDPLILVDLDGAVLLTPRFLVVPRLAAEMERLRRRRKLSLKDLGGPDRED
jgi:bifunctional DNA-binding transcriptional regulator/antitoxin component of YhaV-PrlF toxin-antitoxin module